MPFTEPLVLRLEFPSSLHVLDTLQAAGEQWCRDAGFDDDAVYGIGVAFREAVVNAIRHGNRETPGKHVRAELQRTVGALRGVVLTVQDEGAGFDADAVADPLAPENLLKGSGRGVFLMRSFMDDVVIGRGPGGGTEVRMSKFLSKG